MASTLSDSSHDDHDQTLDHLFNVQFKVITTDEVVSQMNQVIHQVSEILDVSSE